MLWPLWASCTCWAPFEVVAPWNPKVDHNTNLGFLSTKVQSIVETFNTLSIQRKLWWSFLTWFGVCKVIVSWVPWRLIGRLMSKEIICQCEGNRARPMFTFTPDDSKVFFKLTKWSTSFMCFMFVSSSREDREPSYLLNKVSCSGPLCYVTSLYETQVGAKVVPTNPRMYNMASYSSIWALLVVTLVTTLVTKLGLMWRTF